MDAPDLHGLFVNFDQKISNLCAKLALLDVYVKNDSEECKKINVVLGNIQFILHNMNQLLDAAENDFYSQTKRCNQLWELIFDHVQHMETELPKFTVQPGTKNQRMIERNNTYTNINVKNLPKSTKQTAVASSVSCSAVSTVAKNPKKEIDFLFPTMELITDAEYDSIPKYMLSRLSIKTINESVEAINFTIKTKYTFIKKFDVQSTKDSEYKRYQNYKSQENADTKGTHFVTIADIKELSTMKNDATLRKVLICLRHCKRIKEIRTQKLIRYCLI